MTAAVYVETNDPPKLKGEQQVQRSNRVALFYIPLLFVLDRKYRPNHNKSD
jgi:hypothetical protein